MMVIVAGIVVVVIIVITVSLLVGMSFKSFIEITVATATIAGVILAGISFYYKGKEKKVCNSMDRVIDVLGLMRNIHQCVWSNHLCSIDTPTEMDILSILKNLDASLYSERNDISIHFIIDKILSSPTVRDVWNRNKVLFSTNFNEYVSRVG